MICFLVFPSMYRLLLGCGLFFHLQAAIVDGFLMISLSLPLLPPSSTFKDPCDYLWAHPIIQIISLFEGELIGDLNGIDSQVPGVRMVGAVTLPNIIRR